MPPLRFAIRVRPGSGRTAVGGGYDGPRGRALLVSVTAPAVDGRATEAALRAVADALGTRRSAVSLLRGETSRDKLVAVDPATPQVRVRLEELLNRVPP